MESSSILINDAEAFDKAVHGGLPECGDLQFISKAAATVKGQPGVVITFTVALPDGTLQKVQSVTTLSLLKMTAETLVAGHAGIDARARLN